jgi:hypothetical protein
MVFLDTQLALDLSETIRAGICGQTHKISFDRLTLGVMTQILRAIARTGTQNCLSS